MNAIPKFPPVPITTDYALNVALSIAGGSGTGKTYSALLAAEGMTGGEPFAVIDTENKRALHYRSEFPMMQHYNFGPEIGGQMIGFPPERWIAVLDQVEATGVRACVIDSFSHAWEGINGVLELQALEVERLSGGNPEKERRVGQLAWAAVKPRYRRLVERIVQAKMDIIICIRAKPVMQEKSRETGWKEVNARQTKLRRSDIPWDIASDKDLIFEMSASMLMVPERPGVPVLLKCPDHFRNLFPADAAMTREIGAAMRSWAGSGGVDPEMKKLIDQARTEARKGTAAIRAFWTSIGAAKQRSIESLLDELKRTAAEADERMTSDPFATDPDPLPTAEDMAAAEAAALEAARAQEWGEA